MHQYKWENIPEEVMNPLMTRQVVHSANVTVARLKLRKGALVPLHSHLNEQLTTVESGVLHFEAGGESFDLRPGTTLVLPPDLPHQVEALEDSVVTDIFAPPRLDWIRGDDSYLRK